MNAVLAFILRLILVLLSYTFVVWISFLIYNDLNGKGKVSLRKNIPPILFQLDGEDAPEERRYYKPEIILGRDPSCDFPLRDDRVSLRHCKVAYYKNQWWIEDLGSTNGTYLNNSMITTDVVLMNGDIIKLGHQEILIKIE
jgi:pSer/pThr/pTyr-binding forkhead associated (FHA) protein